MISVQELLAEARGWLGVPYQHQGRTRFGVDCIGYVICVRDALEPWPHGMRESRIYSRRPKDGLLIQKLEHYCERLRAPEPGCVVLVSWPKSKFASHVGILTGETMLHCYQRVGRVVENGYREPWVRMTHSYWKLPGVSRE